MTLTVPIPTRPDNPYPLGRYAVHHDDENWAWRALVSPPPKTDTPGAAWWTRDVFDQGDQPRCTTEAAIGLCRTGPLRAGFAADWSQYDSGDERQTLYLASQYVDPIPGQDYDGTTTDAPFRVLRDRGQIASWRWLFGEDELWDYVTNYGPAVLGTVWHQAMFHPDADGYIAPEGFPAGGHAYRVVQAHRNRQAYRIVNSWGRYWGQGGRAWIERQHVAQLLANQGEAVTVG